MRWWPPQLRSETSSTSARNAVLAGAVGMLVILPGIWLTSWHVSGSYDEANLVPLPERAPPLLRAPKPDLSLPPVRYNKINKLGAGPVEITSTAKQLFELHEETAPERDRQLVHFRQPASAKPKPLVQLAAASLQPFKANSNEVGLTQDQTIAPRSTYKSMCIRLCDGFAMPVSFATTSDRLIDDAMKCSASCDLPTRLYVFQNPGGASDEMRDLKGRYYRDLPTAYRYRTTYDRKCTCNPQRGPALTTARSRISVQSPPGFPSAAILQ